MRRQLPRLVAMIGLVLLVGCQDGSEPRESPSEVASPDPTPLVTPSPSEEDPPASSTLRWAIRPPDAIIPTLATTRDGLRVVDTMFEGLTRLDGELEPVPAAASSWRSSRDAEAWTFTLRADGTFHDGSPVTAADVKFAWEEAIRRGRIAPHLADVRGYEAFVAGEADGLAGVLARGQRTLQVLLDRPRADLPVVLAHPSLAPIPRGAYERDPDVFAEQPVGNGAFRATEAWARGRFIRLSAAPESTGQQAGVDEVLFRILDPETAYIAFQQDRVDIATVPAGALDSAIARYGESPDGRTGPGVLRGEAAEVSLLGMDVDASPYDAVAVRRAISFAVDRERLIEAVVPDGNAVPARGITPSPLPGGQASACSTCLHAPDAAERIFSQRDVDSLQLWIDVETGQPEALRERLTADFAAVGVDLSVEQRSLGGLLEAIADGEAGLFRYAWVAEHAMIEDMLVPLLSSGSIGVATGNPGGYRSAEVDELLDEALVTTDTDARHDLLREAERIAVGREQAVVPLFVPQHRLVVGERVAGFRLRPTGRAELTGVRLDAGAGGR